MDAVGGAAHHCGLTAIFRVVGTLGDEDVSLWEQKITTSSPEAAHRPSHLFFSAIILFFFAALSCCRFVSSVSSGSPPPPTEPLSTLQSNDCIFFYFLLQCFGFKPELEICGERRFPSSGSTFSRGGVTVRVLTGKTCTAFLRVRIGWVGKKKKMREVVLPD